MNDDDLGKRMGQNWDERAKRDPLHWTVNCVPEGQWDVEEYLETGEATLGNSLDAYQRDRGFDTADMDCLEIGCGAGRLTHALLKRFRRVTGLDVSALMIERAKEMCRADADRVRFVLGNGVDFQPLGSGSFDFVYSVIVFQHIPSEQIQLAYLKEAARVLRQGGHYLIELYNDWKEYEWVKPAWEKRRQAGKAGSWGPLAQLELDRYETSMCNPVHADSVAKTLEDARAPIVWELGRGTGVWWVGGLKQ